MIKTLVTAFFLTTVTLTPAALAADPAAGEKVFKRCSACHSLEEGKNKVGPTLINIVGAKAGAVEGYKYSKALLEADLTWDEATLKAFLAKPKAVIPKSKMIFAGLKKEEQIDDLIAYLKTVTSQ